MPLAPRRLNDVASLATRLAVLENELQALRHEVERVAELQRKLNDQIVLDRAVFVSRDDFAKNADDTSHWRERANAQISVLWWAVGGIGILASILGALIGKFMLP